MKKFLVLFSSLLLIVAISQAQPIIPAATGGTFQKVGVFSPGGANYFNYVGVDADTAAHTLAIKYKYWDLSKANTAMDYIITSTITRTSGNVAGHKIALEGSVDNTNWTQIRAFILTDVASTVNTWTSTDTTTKFILYPHLRFYLDSDGAGVSKISNVSLKVVPKYSIR